MGIRGYKVFNPDWTCRGFQYEVGKTFEHEGNIEMCKSGFHFCMKASDCFNYYEFDCKNKVAEVEAIGKIETKGNKSVTDKIAIIREISWHELLDIVNEGRGCTGLCNSGNWNTGNYNSGDYNSGDLNAGNWNSRYWNTGSWNTGSCNSGYYNSGDYNSGNWNSGNWNKTDYSSGFFNTKEFPVIAFNKSCNISRDGFLKSEGMLILFGHYKNNWWVNSADMTEEEKKEHPEYETTDGYLKTVDFKTACKMLWDSLDNYEKRAVRKIPNFDADIFMEITGIDAND